MTAPAPRADGQPRLHVHKVGSHQWNVDTGHNTLVLFAAPGMPQAIKQAEHLLAPYRH